MRICSAIIQKSKPDSVLCRVTPVWRTLAFGIQFKERASSFRLASDHDLINRKKEPQNPGLLPGSAKTEV
jgi:hypothetical protein